MQELSRLLLAGLCHQLPTRSFDGWIACHHCAGLYLGHLLAVIVSGMPLKALARVRARCREPGTRFALAIPLLVALPIEAFAFPATTLSCPTAWPSARVISGALAGLGVWLLTAHRTGIAPTARPLGRTVGLLSALSLLMLAGINSVLGLACVVLVFRVTHFVLVGACELGPLGGLLPLRARGPAALFVSVAVLVWLGLAR